MQKHVPRWAAEAGAAKPNDSGRNQKKQILSLLSVKMRAEITSETSPVERGLIRMRPGLFTMRGRQNCEGLFLLGHCSKFVVPTVHPRGELVNLQKTASTSEESPQTSNQTPVVVNNSGEKITFRIWLRSTVCGVTTESASGLSKLK